MEALKELQKSSLDAAEECNKCAEDARFKKNTTRAVGGAVAGTTLAAGVAGGVAASVVAGVFTFGHVHLWG